MKEKYRPKTVSEKLGYLIEECGELQAALGKTMRWGWYSSNPEPDTPDTTNREWVLAEMEDVAPPAFQGGHTPRDTLETRC